MTEKEFKEESFRKFIRWSILSIVILLWAILMALIIRL
jgi:hypothetical protein